MKHLIIAITILCLSLNTMGQSSGQPNFIIFIADDVSWNDLGCYGNDEVVTPNIDQLATRSIRFTNAYLTASSCSPSRNSIMTGRYPHNTGAAELHSEPPLNMVSLPQVLRQNGYYSVSSGKFHMGKYIEKGFDMIYRNGADIGNGGELSWVKSVQERPKDQPFFMWFAALDAHRAWGENDFSGTHQASQLNVPFYLADAEATREDLASYYDEITRFDHYIGLVIKELESQQVLDRTVVMIMADNGRPFPHSKTRVNDRGMKTPFLIHWPEKIEEELTSQALVSSIDIAATILDLAGLEAPETVQGISFSKLIESPEQTHRSVLFAEHNWHDYEAYERMARSDEYMYIYNARPDQPQLGPADAVGSPSYSDLNHLKATGKLSVVQADIFATPRPAEELYHLTKDPWQLNNIASNLEYQDQLMEMRKLLETWQTETGDNLPGQLTPDWYAKEPGYVKTRAHGVRGEMPGESLQATQNNQKGPF